LRASTFFCAVSIAFDSHLLPIASPSSMFAAHHPCEQRVGAKNPQQVIVQAEVESATTPDRPVDPIGRAAGYRCGALSWRSVPSTNSPPAAITSCLFGGDLGFGSA
jgi:hypothetical protein